MNDSARSLSVLKKLLEKKPQVSSLKAENLAGQLSDYFWENDLSSEKVFKRRPGRPKVKDENKAKNITLCLGQKYLKFLDEFRPHQKKILGRGRKVRFIIDEFVVLYKRQKLQLEVLAEMLKSLESILKSHSHKVKKGQKVELSQSEKNEISKQVSPIITFLKMYGYTPKDLQKILSKDLWALVAFALDWRRQYGA